MEAWWHRNHGGIGGKRQAQIAMPKAKGGARPAAIARSEAGVGVTGGIRGTGAGSVRDGSMLVMPTRWSASHLVRVRVKVRVRVEGRA